MAKQEIIISNKLIAEFMGDIDSADSCVSFNKCCTIFDFKYHFLWDWLLPVIAKCTDTFKNYQYDSEEYEYITEEIFHPDYCLNAFMNNDIEDIYERVVLYIKYHNKHCKTNSKLIEGNDMLQG